MEPYIMAYKVSNYDLPLACSKMNGHWDNFESRIINIIVGTTSSTLIVELKGSYPFIQNQ